MRVPLNITEVEPICFGKNPPSKCEIFIDDKWVEFDAHGKDTKESRDFYKRAFRVIAEGSFPLRYNEKISSKPSSEDSVFYRYK